MLVSGYEINSGIYQGFYHFGEYFTYASNFRSQVVRIGNDSKLTQIEAWDIYPDSDIKLDVSTIDKKIMSKSLTPMKLAEIVGHQPETLKELSYEVLKRQISVNKNQVLVLPGSSMIAIFYTLNIAFQQHFQRFHDEHFEAINRKSSFIRKFRRFTYRKPCVIGVQGSFKCGGSFPFLNGGELIYAESLGSNFIPTAQSISDAFSIAEKAERIPVAFIWEEPTAMGYIFQEKELSQVAEVLKSQLSKYPQMIILVDAYNGGLFQQSRIPSLFDDAEIRPHAIYTTSMRKKIPAANYGLVTPIACGSDKIRQRMSIFFGSNSFYTVHPFSHLHYLVAQNILEQFLEKGSSVNYNFPIFDFAQSLIYEVNSTLDGTYLSPYASPDAGINYFVCFNTDFLEKQRCRDALHLCQVLSLVTGVHCSVPSAMGIPGYGVRINLMRSQESLTSEGFSSNQQYASIVFQRFQFFLLALIRKHISILDFEKALDCVESGDQYISKHIVELQNSFLDFMDTENGQSLVRSSIAIASIKS